MTCLKRLKDIGLHKHMQKIEPKISQIIELKHLIEEQTLHNRLHHCKCLYSVTVNVKMLTKVYVSMS